MPKPRPLTPAEAKRTLTQRLAPRVDSLRQFSTRFGLRSRRVFLVWTKYSGYERGEGNEYEVARVELLPTPKVSALTNLTLTPYAAGILPVGSVRVELISATFSSEELLGQVPPATPTGEPIEQPWDFFYEIVEDHRVSDHPARQKFRVLGTPSRDEGSVSWSLILDRVDEDRSPDGRSMYGADDVVNRGRLLPGRR
jgi:hypothetical protein